MDQWKGHRGILLATTHGMLKDKNSAVQSLPRGVISVQDHDGAICKGVFVIDSNVPSSIGSIQDAVAPRAIDLELISTHRGIPREDDAICNRQSSASKVGYCSASGRERFIREECATFVDSSKRND